MGRERTWVASALTVVLVAGCGAESESGPVVEPGPTIALPAEPVPAAWGPTPLSTVWDAAPGIDLDSRPAQIARALVDGYVYIDALMGMDEGYPGLSEFSGFYHNQRIPDELPPKTGTVYNYILEIPATPSAGETQYRAVVCHSLANFTAWADYANSWIRLDVLSFAIRFSLPGDPIPLSDSGVVDRIDMADRVQHPTWNVFAGAEYLARPGRLEDQGTIEGNKAIRTECEKHLPVEPPQGGQRLDAPLAPEPWYPGWPAPSD